jgi:hypothetical protein
MSSYLGDLGEAKKKEARQAEERRMAPIFQFRPRSLTKPIKSLEKPSSAPLAGGIWQDFWHWLPLPPDPPRYPGGGLSLSTALKEEIRAELPATESPPSQPPTSTMPVVSTIVIESKPLFSDLPFPPIAAVPTCSDLQFYIRLTGCTR